MTISISSAYSLAEAVSARHSLNLDLVQGRLFYGVAIASTLLAAGIVLIPGAPLLAVTLTVNVIATLLMAPALLSLLLLANECEIMRGLANRWRANLAEGTIAVAISLVSVLYAVITVFPSLLVSSRRSVQDNPAQIGALEPSQRTAAMQHQLPRLSLGRGT